MPWFKVVADSFDWVPKRGVMYAFKKDDVHFGTVACVEYGLKHGKIVRTARPPGAKVEKSGKVALNG